MRLEELEKRIEARLPAAKGGKVRCFYRLMEADEGAELKPREREREGVRRLMKEIFGESAEVEHKPSGAPIASGVECDVEISISHSGDMVSVVTAPKGWRVGVDIEGMGRSSQLERIARRFLTADELKTVADCGGLVWAWTVKEALYKGEDRAGWWLTDIPLPERGGTAAGYVVESMVVGEMMMTVAVKEPN